MNLTNNCHILESTFSFDSIDAYYYIFYLCRRNRPKLSFLTCCLYNLHLQEREITYTIIK